MGGVTASQRATEVWQCAGMSPNPHTEFVSYQRSKALAETTIRNRSSIIRSFERFTGSPAHAAGVAELRAYIGRADVAAGTRRTERNALRTYFAYLLEDGHRDDDPSLKLPPVKAPKGEPRPFTPAQIDAMLHSGAYRRTRAMILLGYYQGLRVSSIARVHGSHIDHDAQTIAVLGKGGKERVLPLHPMSAELSRAMPPADWWFPARAGRTGHISGHAVTELITAAKLRAGITDPKLTPHSLRHAFGTDLVEAGVDIRVVQELMMHESLQTTQIYTGVSARLKREGLSVLAPRAVPSASGRQRAA